MILKLTRGRSSVVDDEDAQLLLRYRWYCTANGYAGAMTVVDGKRSLLLLHRRIVAAGKSDIVDHFNGDRLDNRRRNLRIVSQLVNQINRHKLNSNNSSGVRGVRFKSNKWEARIRTQGKDISLGVFATIEAAMAARRAGEMEIWGELCPIIQAGGLQR